MKSITALQCLPYSDCLWKPGNGRLTPPLRVHLPSRDRKCIVLRAVGGGNRNGNGNGNGEKRASEEYKLDEEDIMQLKFGLLLGEDHEKTWAKVIGKKLYPDMTYLDIEKSMEGKKGISLGLPLPRLTDAQKQELTNFSNKLSVSVNTTDKRKSLDLVRPVRRDGKDVASPTDPNKLGNQTKSLPTESNSKNITHDVSLRKPSARSKARESLGFADQPRTPYLLSNKRQDKSKRSLEDIGLLRRPEKIDQNESKSLGDLKAKEGIIKNYLGSKTGSADIYAAAHNQFSEREDLKREHKIAAIRPTMPRGQVISTVHEMDPKRLNRNVKLEHHQETILSQVNEDVGSVPSIETQEMDDSALASTKSHMMPKADINISVLVATPPVKMKSEKNEECIQDCKEGVEIKSESQSIQQKTGIESEPVKLDAIFSKGSMSGHLSEANTVKRKSTECLDSPGHPLVNEIPGQHINGVHDVTDTGVDFPSCGQDFIERTYISDAAEDNIEKSFSQLTDSILSDYSDKALYVSYETVNPPTLVDSVIPKRFYEIGSLASTRHAKKFERDLQISDQSNETFSQAVKEGEERDWARAEILHKSGGFEEVELLSCNNMGFVVSFGSLLGLLPYRYINSKRRPFPFEAWLRQKGLDPSKFQKDIWSESSTHFDNMSTLVLTTSPSDKDTIQSRDEKSSAVTTKEYQNLLNLYNQYRTRFLSSFVGRKTRADVTLVDRKSGRLLFSEKLRESQESTEKKTSLMDKLNIGDIVTCQVTQITSFGVFVELEGVYALIHRSELSWDPVWDVNSYLKVGEEVKAKVCRLDYSLQHIDLSLKQMKPDPLLESLESAVNNEDDHTTGILELAEQKKEWPEVELLIRELEVVAGIRSVTKGRFLLTPGLAPTFQVYLSDSCGDRYKILARSRNRVQEIVVQASLDRDEIKSAIVSCTSQVAQEL